MPSDPNEPPQSPEAQDEGPIVPVAIEPAPAGEQLCFEIVGAIDDPDAELIITI